jgi:hypothetical protein
VESTIVLSIIALVASVITASVTYYLTKKQQFALEERRLKEEFYRGFVKALSDVAMDNSDEAAIDRLSNGFNTLTLVANKEVVALLMEFHAFVSKKNSIPRDSPEWATRHDKLYTELIRQMRGDLFGRMEEVASFPPVHLAGRGPRMGEGVRR